MTHASLRRIANAGLLSFAVAALGACSEQSPVTPNGGPPSFGTIPGGTGLPTTNVPTGEVFKVCKVYSGTVGPDVSILVQVDEGNNGSEDHNFSVSVGDGECVAVWSTGGNAGTTDLVTVTETLPGGYTVALVKATVEDGVTTTGASVASNTTFNTITNPGGTGTDGVVVTFTNEAIPDEGCTLTQGFWKTHTGLGPQADAWPALPGGTMTLGTVAYTKAQLISIFNTPVKGNGLISLAHQLIAANLNILNGASATDISASITAANTLIGGLVVPPVGSGSLAPSATGALTTALAQYNEGVTGPGHCDAEE